MSAGGDVSERTHDDSNPDPLSPCCCEEMDFYEQFWDCETIGQVSDLASQFLQAANPDVKFDYSRLAEELLSSVGASLRNLTVCELDARHEDEKWASKDEDYRAAHDAVTERVRVLASKLRQLNVGSMPKRDMRTMLAYAMGNRNVREKVGELLEWIAIASDEEVRSVAFPHIPAEFVTLKPSLTREERQRLLRHSRKLFAQVMVGDVSPEDALRIVDGSTVGDSQPDSVPKEPIE